MVAITQLLAYVAVASAAAVVQRDVAQVQKDLTQIDTDVNKLTQQLKSWDGTLFGATGVQSAESAVETDLKTAKSDADASSAATAAQASSIITYINGTLEPDVKTSLNTLTGRKADLQKSGLLNTAKANIATLKNLTDSLGASLKAKTPTAQQATAQSLIDKLDADFIAANKTLYA